MHGDDTYNTYVYLLCIIPNYKHTMHTHFEIILFDKNIYAVWLFATINPASRPHIFTDFIFWI